MSTTQVGFKNVPSIKTRTVFRKKQPRNAKAIRRIARQEVKKVNRATQELNIFTPALLGAGTNITAAGSVFALSSTIVKGDDADNRQGREITYKSFLMRWACLHDDNTNFMRMIIFRWNNSGTPSVASVLEDTVTLPYLSPIKISDAKSVQVIRDASWATTSATDAATLGKIYLDEKKGLRGKAIWSTTGAFLPDHGQLYMLLISDSAVSGPLFKFSARLRYLE